MYESCFLFASQAVGHDNGTSKRTCMDVTHQTEDSTAATIGYLRNTQQKHNHHTLQYYVIIN